MSAGSSSAIRSATIAITASSSTSVNPLFRPTALRPISPLDPLAPSILPARLLEPRQLLFVAERYPKHHILRRNVFDRSIEEADVDPAELFVGDPVAGAKVGVADGVGVVAFETHVDQHRELLLPRCLGVGDPQEKALWVHYGRHRPAPVKVDERAAALERTRVVPHSTVVFIVVLHLKRRAKNGLEGSHAAGDEEALA